MLHLDIFSHILLYVNKQDLCVMKDIINDCAYFAECGYLNLLKLAHANGIFITSQVCINAATNGHLDILQWLKAEDLSWDHDACDYAARNCHFDVLNYIHFAKYQSRTSPQKAQCLCGDYYLDHATRDGNLDVLRWAFDNKYIIHHHLLTLAAREGKCEILGWLHKIAGHKLNDTLYISAAISGHIGILEWLWENKCSMSNFTRDMIMLIDNFRVIDWVNSRSF